MDPNPNPTSASTSTPTPTRPARLTTAERKRLTDRKAQRQRRERIKTYIARLEKTLEELTAASGNGMEATLLKQLEQQRLKTERLTGVINHIHEVLEETRGSMGEGEEEGASGSGSLSSGSTTAAATTLPAGRRVLKSAGQEQKQHEHEHQHQQQRQRQESSGSNERALPFTISTDLSKKISLHTQNPSNSGTRNYFEIVNETISNVAKEQDSIIPSTTADDDDLAIRAILYGWDSISSGRGEKRLDRVWGLLQALDQGIFSQTGLVERVAILRLMRAMIQWNLSPQDHTIPSYMFPTVTQSMVPHAPIIDFFAWPNLRDHLIVSGITNITETTSALYVSQIRLKWPYELRDICKYNVAENKYRFSSEFDTVFYDLDSWTIESPQLQILIDSGPAMAAFHPSNLPTHGDDDGDVDAGSYWDRLLDSCDQM
ncbi:hypothetical protein BJY04DRAFT_215609 [Aspergillus karnatakaensis]|uniref:uncharacterized protein n=1 Tax=Aspergillus karnatakaensis TaxID=1810916 RepID=UPI003CCD4824